jgi:hypothetical protein
MECKQQDLEPIPRRLELLHGNNGKNLVCYALIIFTYFRNKKQDIQFHSSYSVNGK